MIHFHFNTDLINQIGNVQSQIPMRPIGQKKAVTNCLTQTTEAGYYQYHEEASDKPSSVGGIVISYPWFKTNEEALPTRTMRIAIDFNGEIYTSVYISGQSYGTWVKK